MEYSKVSILLLSFCISVVYSAHIAPKLIGGSNPADGKTFNYVAMVVDVPTGNICGGFVVNKNWVVTAAHCVTTTDPVQVYVTTGTLQISFASRIERHNEYDKTNFVNDIVAIQLNETLTFSDTLGSIEVVTETVADGINCTATGFSAVSPRASVSFSHIDVQIKKASECSAADGQICTAVGDAGIGALCKNDAGSPLVCGGKVAGIAITENCNRPGKNFELYQDMSLVKGWLDGVSSSATIFLNPFTLLATVIAILRARC